ncbi:unnamed protein product [Caenorhabditis auriculariae]|uniref:VWFA domain-containing protein n=1 Tax=Caenorhabditis auriculariae TaxID=2777116 RepID=A0A8S1HU67_9PELO|nr:unnamed protein product [Caenorhabditis auriculariae]
MNKVDIYLRRTPAAMLLTWIFAASFFAVVAGDTSAYIFCLTAGGSWEAPAKGPPICRGYNARFESKTKKEAEDACAYKVPFDVVGVKTGWPTLCDFEVRATCPDGYIQLHRECFRATSVLIYQHQARAACRNLTGVDGTLLKLTSSKLQWEIYAAFTNLHGLWLDVDGRRNKNGELESSLDVLYKWKRPRNTISTGGSNETHQLMAITQAGVWEVGAHRILYDVPNSVKAMAICKFKPTAQSIGISSNVYDKMMLLSFSNMYRYERDPQNENQINPVELHEKCKSLCESFGMPCYAVVPTANNAKDLLDFMRKERHQVRPHADPPFHCPERYWRLQSQWRRRRSRPVRRCRPTVDGLCRVFRKVSLPDGLWKNGPKDACSATPRVGVIFQEKQEQLFETIPVVEARLICATVSGDSVVKSCSKRAIFFDGKCKCKPGYTDANENSNGPRGIKCISCQVQHKKIILGIMFDSSGSISSYDYNKKILPLVQNLYRSTYGNYVILTKFSNAATVIDYSGKSHVEDAVEQIPKDFVYDHGGTDTTSAIQETHEKMMALKNKYPSSTMHMILITDGAPDDRYKAASAGKKAREDGIKMQTVLIGSGAEKQAKLVNCGDVDASNEECGIRAVSFPEVNEDLSKDLLVTVCDEDNSAVLSG